MTLTQKTTHVSEGQGQLIEQFKNKPNIEALVGSYLGQIQEIEDVVWQLLSIPGSIDDQEGEQLDLWGRIVGQSRNGRPDAVYRQWIQARLIVNRASGLPDELRTIVDLITDNEHTYEEYYPAGFLITLIDAYAGDAAALAALLTKTRAAGVEGGLIYSPADDDETFTFADADAEQASTDQGWAGDDEMVTNGAFDAWTADDPDDWIVTENLVDTFVTEVGSGQSYGGAGTGACNLYCTSAVNVAQIEQQWSDLIVGASYRLTIVISAIGGSCWVEDLVRGAFGPAVYTTPGTKTIDFTATHVDSSVAAIAYGVTSDVTIDFMALEPYPPFGGSFADVEEI